MANIKLFKTRTEVIRIDAVTKKFLRDLSFDLSSIEKNKVTTPEILKRTFNSSDIIEKLKIGSLDRRKNKKWN